MTQLPSLEELDVDGAIGEAAEHVDGKTRADFLRKAGLGAGTIVGGSALLGVVALRRVGRHHQGRHRDPQLRVDARVPRGRVLRRGRRARASSAARPPSSPTSSRATRTAHVAFLKGSLGRKAVAKPTVQLPRHDHRPGEVPGHRQDARGHRRRRVPRPGRQHQVEQDPRRRPARSFRSRLATRPGSGTSSVAATRGVTGAGRLPGRDARRPRSWRPSRPPASSSS